MKYKDWVVIYSYAVAVLGAIASTTFPALFDALLSFFGIPPGEGAKVSMLAFTLLGLVTLIKSKIDAVHATSNAQTDATDAHLSARVADAKATLALTQQKGSTPL